MSEQWSVGPNTGFGFSIDDDDGPPVAHVRYSDNPRATRDIALRRAHLFVAAPGLLVACETIRNMAKLRNDCKGFLTVAEDALAKYEKEVKNV